MTALRENLLHKNRRFAEHFFRLSAISSRTSSTEKVFSVLKESIPFLISEAKTPFPSVKASALQVIIPPPLSVFTSCPCFAEKSKTFRRHFMKNKFQQFTVCLALTAAFGLSSRVSASGIPVVDAAAIELAQQHQLQNFAQMLKDYEQMILQYQQAVSTYKNFTGSRMLGLVDYDTALRQFLPSNAKSRLNSIINGGSLSSLGKEFFDRLNLGAACESFEGEVKEYCLKSQNYKAETQAVLEESKQNVEKRLQNIESLMTRINSAEDAKTIADLSARIQAEQVALSASQNVAEFQKAAMKQEAAEVEKTARQEALKKMFPEMTESALKEALEPVKGQ